MLIGNGRAGKGTFCKVALNSFGLTSKSSSRMGCEMGLYEKFKDMFGYADMEECYNDRHSKRELWYQGICDLCDPNKSAVGRAIYNLHDIYDGCRDDLELNAIKAEGLIDLVIWIDAGDRVQAEGSGSMKLTKDDADIVIYNTTTEAEYIEKVKRFLSALTKGGVSYEC
tara:strand:+ start:4923 stop:5429 length:507 start_codon:yes stop_codon:yes gene_type:complete